jgi:pyrimidine operon attenuation protein/uracil phosphoribosyltransferase
VTRKRYSARDVDAWLDAMAETLGRLRDTHGIGTWHFVGIQTGGVWVAGALAERLRHKEPIGALNIAFYRDDFSRIGMHPTVTPSRLPFEVDDGHIVLVDDILYTGRTVRAAMNEIFDYGRPAGIHLAVLVDRGGRELPIEAAVVGTRIDLGSDEHAKLTGPEPLELLVHERDS